MAERAGFEPAVGRKPYNGLASRRFRPLSHLSAFAMQRQAQDAPGTPSNVTPRRRAVKCLSRAGRTGESPRHATAERVYLPCGAGIDRLSASGLWRLPLFVDNTPYEELR